MTFTQPITFAAITRQFFSAAKFIYGHNLFTFRALLMPKRIVFITECALVVMASMFSIGHKFQICDSVIALITILVVNHFVVQKFAPEMLFHKMSMHVSRLSINAHMGVRGQYTSAFNPFARAQRITVTFQSVIVHHAIRFRKMWLITAWHRTCSHTGQLTPAPMLGQHKAA